MAKTSVRPNARKEVSGDMDIQEIAVELGFSPLDASTLFGLSRLQQIGERYDLVRALPAYEELRKRREEGEIDPEEFLRQVETLAAQLSPPPGSSS